MAWWDLRCAERGNKDPTNTEMAMELRSNSTAGLVKLGLGHGPNRQTHRIFLIF